MRVLIVTDWYPAEPNDPGGSFVRAQALAVAGRHEVVVLHLDGRGGPIREDKDGPMRVLRPRGDASTLPVTVANARTLMAAVRQRGLAPHVVHAHGFSAGFAGLALARGRGLPLVVSEHASIFAGGGMNRAGRLVARVVFAGANLVCPVSVSQRDVLAAAGYRGPFRVVPNPVDVELFTPGHPPSHPVAVAVGSLRDIKGTADLVEATALAESAGRGLVVHVVGDGPLRESLTRRVRALGLEERVVFHGKLPPLDVAAHLRRASFAVVPSRWETFSVALSEALVCGLPVVATSVGGLPERVNDSNGILCAPADPAALARALERMIVERDSFDRQAIAAEARATLSPTVIAATWDEIYAQLRPTGAGRARWRRQRP